MEENKNQAETIEISKDSDKIIDNKESSNIQQHQIINPINNTNELVLPVVRLFFLKLF